MVSCGHPECKFSTRVELDVDPGPWQPATVSDILGPDGEPVVTLWAGQPIIDAYQQHWGQVHQPQGQPPMCQARIVA